MSYILNALRKSERERQAMQPDTVTSRIAIEQTPERHGLTKIIVALVLMNLAILVYFLGIAPQTPADKPQPLATIEEPAPLSAKTNPPTRARMSPEPKVEPPRNQTPAPEKVTSNNKPVIEPVQRVKPTVAPQQQPAKPMSAAIAEKAPASKPITEPEPHSSTVPQAHEEPGEAAAKKPEPVKIQPAQNDLPTLQDLPPEVRLSLPSLPINVFSYSPTPAERFVMIDMIKYVPGQTIKDQLELKEIAEDGIIVRYQGRVFKIKR